VTLAALLTLFSILLAVLALARPVGRRSLTLFVPLWRLVAAIFLSLALIICRDAPFGMRPPFGWSLSKTMFGLTLGAFLIPVLAGLWAWASWYRATLTGERLIRVESVFRAAMRERKFDEVERIVRKNQDRLERLPATGTAVLFAPVIVEALVGSHSLVHLELLANMQFLKALENRHLAVDVVVRELLRSDVSPLRSAVVARYGGLEHFTYADSERALMERTFQNPQWYSEASAHYPLVISSVETLRGGKLDTDYNDVGRDYEASQGISRRSRCPIYLAVKTEVLAIEAALEGHVEKDFYVTDLFDVFRAVKERSKYDETVWKSPLSNSEFPTPYAYLLYTITADLDDLSCTAVREAIGSSAREQAGEPRQAQAPGEVARALARTWSFCVWSIADSKCQVAPEFRTSIIEQYLLFVLKLGWEPRSVCFGGIGAVEDLTVWRDVFLNELRSRFSGRDFLRWVPLQEAMRSLDQGKRYVMEGYPWVEKELSATPR
jgi:hypothetical protein